jgi:ribosomal protein S6--L-glutamate ligase
VKIAILSRQPDLYSNRRLMAAAAERNWQAAVIDPLQDKAGDALPPDFGEGIDAVIPRYSPFWQRRAHGVLKQIQALGIRSLNDADAIALARDAPACLQAFAGCGLPFPESVSMLEASLTADWLDRLPFAFPMVLKRHSSSQGQGVELYRDGIALSDRVQTLMDRHEPFLLQEFIAEAEASDLRLMVADGHVIAAMQRTARSGEFRANVHLGGLARPVQVGRDVCDLAVQAASVVGLRLAGVDIITSCRGPLVLEVNASPGFEALETVTGVDVAGKLLDLLEAA